jgi:hypothetical protein
MNNICVEVTQLHAICCVVFHMTNFDFISEWLDEWKFQIAEEHLYLFYLTTPFNNSVYNVE